MAVHFLVGQYIFYWDSKFSIGRVHFLLGQYIFLLGQYIFTLEPYIFVLGQYIFYSGSTFSTAVIGVANFAHTVTSGSIMLLISHMLLPENQSQYKILILFNYTKILLSPTKTYTIRWLVFSRQTTYISNLISILIIFSISNPDFFFQLSNFQNSFSKYNSISQFNSDSMSGIYLN